MSRPRPRVTSINKKSDHLPEWANAFAFLVLTLQKRDQLTRLAERCHFYRQGGYSGADLILTLFAFFTSRLPGGIKTVWNTHIRHYSELLAALAGRRSLASPASLSRGLSRLTQDKTQEWAPFLCYQMLDKTALTELFEHPSVQHQDANGEGWHVFDFDPTIKACRQRALPEGEELPSPERRLDDLAAPGYSGRKRGQVLFSAAPTEHAGTGLTIDTSISQGNTPTRSGLTRACAAVVSFLDYIDVSHTRGVLRADGAFGHVPAIVSAREAGLPFLSRLNRPKLLDNSDIIAHINEGVWQLVPDSGSGPQRAALDLGMQTIAAAPSTTREDDTPYEPVSVRVVVSRFPCKNKRGAGKQIGDWRYELFVADGLDSKAWPASDVVATYFARAVQENRFHQKNTELGLNRVFHTSLAGQELATLVGLSLWNQRIIEGFAVAPSQKKSVKYQSPVA